MSTKFEEVPTKDIGNEEMVKEPRRKLKGWSRYHITVEPIMFLVPFVMNFTAGITIDLLQQNVCYQYFNMSYEDCGKELPVEIKADIEAETADVNMYNNLIQGICPIILVLCVGPWSDVNGRKHFLYWGLRGFIIFNAIWGVLSIFPMIPVMYFIFPAIPLSLSGGWVSVLVSCQTYMADVWPYDVRPFRISINIFCGIMGNVVANALSAPVFYNTGKYAYQVMFFSSCIIAILGHLYAQLVVEETVIRKGKRTRLLDFNHMKSIVTVLVVKPISGRFITLLTMTILTTEITSWVGEANLIYLIGKSSFNWTLGDYNLFNSVVTVINAVSPVVGMWLLKEKFQWHSYTILSLSSCGMFLFNVLKTLSATEAMFWIVSGFSRMFSIVGPCVDTELSLLVNKTDLGKAFAFSCLLDAIAPVVSLPLFNLLYKAFLPDKTLRMYLLSSLLSSMTAASSLALLWKRYRSPDKIPSENAAVKESRLCRETA